MAADQQRRVKLIVSYGGRIERAEGRPPRYVGGEHLLLNVLSSVSTRGFRDLLAARAGFSNFSVKYCYSGEGLDSLCDVDTDEDLRDMLDILHYRDLQARLFNDQNRRRFRVYLFRDAAAAPSPTSQSLRKPAPMRRSATSPALLPAKPADVDGRPSQGLAAPAPSPVPRIMTSPNPLCETSTAGTAPSKPPLASALARRIASSPLLTADSTDDTASLIITTSTSAARATQHTPPHAAAFRTAESPNPLCEMLTAGTAPSKPSLAPAPARRIASSPLLTADSTDDTASLITTTSTSAARATQHTPPLAE
uniref:PB1 domain-containing protein n=1 Tax=Aegilops tauschii subsp. strangulata TaxID=200361 RepID=A0A453C189_AEGTS